MAAAAAKLFLDDADDSGLSQSSSSETRKVSPDSVGGHRHRSTDVSLLLDEVKEV